MCDLRVLRIFFQDCLSHTSAINSPLTRSKEKRFDRSNMVWDMDKARKLITKKFSGLCAEEGFLEGHQPVEEVSERINGFSTLALEAEDVDTADRPTEYTEQRFHVKADSAGSRLLFIVMISTDGSGTVTAILVEPRSSEPADDSNYSVLTVTVDLSNLSRASRSTQ